MKNKTLPILLTNKKILLIGGGAVALQKATVLFDNNIEFKIIAKTVDDKIKSLTKNIQIEKFKLKDIKDFYIIIDATGNKKVTKKLLTYKKDNNILLNVVDVPKNCDFYFMALTKNRPLQIAVSSNGASPTSAQYFRDECEKLIPNNITKFIEQKQLQRDNHIIDIDKTTKELKQISSKVYLVGCGLGDVELLTIKAYKVIQTVDIVLYDHLISKQILDIVPKTTKKVFVGKQKGYHSLSQDKINKLIIKYVKKGYKVARLKSGDPFVFGRGSEELYELCKSSIDTEVIPGISSSISAPLLANIPITARGFASSFTVVSAHLKDNRINLDWIELLKKKNHTIIVLMGLSKIDAIVKECINLDISLDKPCAIISNASRDNQQTLISTISELSKISKNIQSPAILVFGDVVNFKKLHPNL